MFILGIESSCDDTGVAVIAAHADGTVDILSNIITRQDHVQTGGVVPEVAARHHASAINPTIQQALSESRKSLEDIDAIAVTRGPGMIACLLVGVEAATTIAATRNIPILGINHMEAHIASTFAEHPHIDFPAVVLLASGGHTMLVSMKSRHDFELLGETRDDAAGEAFDKIAKMIDLPYPGGPEIARLAEQGNPKAYDFPRPMKADNNLDFSFAGLKTHVLYFVQKLQENGGPSEQERADIAASAQEAIVDVLVSKTMRAAQEQNAKTVILGGGVSANAELRTRLDQVITTERPETKVVVPSPGLFTDNGAMIAIAAAPRALAGDFDTWSDIEVNPKLRLAG